MALLIIFLVSLPVLSYFLYLLRKRINKAKTTSGLLPLGPRGLPLIGNLHQLESTNLHYQLWNLSKKYGPLMSLRLGLVQTVVVSSVKMAKEALKTHDVEFSGRPALVGQQKLTYNGLDVAFAPYNDYWKEMRKICVTHLFNASRVHNFSSLYKLLAKMSKGGDIGRRTANYHPDIWGDRFINYNSEDEIYHGAQSQEIEELKEEVRRELLGCSADSLTQLKLIDAILRLGVGYQFERELEEALQNLCDAYSNNFYNIEDDDPYHVALRFRLLRQRGYKVSCDIFNQFKDGKGNFKESLKTDVSGMLSLYEAAHLGVHGEDILDEAIAFTTTHLQSSMAPKVIHALLQPLHKGMPRLEARWWKDLNFAGKLPFARDRVVESYFWIVGVYFEPEYSLARKLLAKIFSMTSIIDYIYDVYATPKELDLFTAAIDRWDMSCMNQLPEYMQIFYEALLDLYKEIEEELATKGWSYRVHYAKEEMKILVHGYHDESKWFHNNYVPTMEEYMRVSLVTSAYSMLTAAYFLGMDSVVTKEAFDWVSEKPRIIRASTIIGRLVNDIKSHKFEQERGHPASAIEYYMKEKEREGVSVTEQEVHEELYKKVGDAWKDINEEFLMPTEVPRALLMRVLNLSRVIDIIYKEADDYTHVGQVMKDNIASVLIHPVAI
ncbi:alpha-humulene/(-)-(E)-beta-caryophyllene synthase [Citrus sinensis]|nr:alpha-humulene/(-)-(E)-beta-caryophyllene synthase [Citrus sinensis]